MEQVFTHVFNTTYDCFEFAYRTLTSIHIFGNVSIFDMLLAFFVCSIVPILVATTFGGRGIAIGASTAIKHSTSKDPKYNKSYKALKGAKK